MKKIFVILSIMSLSVCSFANESLIHSTKQKFKVSFKAKYPQKEFIETKHDKYKKVKEEAVKEVYPDNVPEDLFINPVKKAVLYKKVKDKIKLKDEGKVSEEKLKFYLNSDPKFKSQVEGEEEETAIASISQEMPTAAGMTESAEVLESSEVSEL